MPYARTYGLCFVGTLYKLHETNLIFSVNKGTHKMTKNTTKVAMKEKKLDNVYCQLFKSLSSVRRYMAVSSDSVQTSCVLGYLSFNYAIST